VAPNFKIIISATDSATQRLEAINKKLAEARAPAERLTKQLSTFARLSGVQAVGQGFERMARGAYSAFQSVARIVAPLSAIAGAASVAGMYKLVEAWGQWGSQLGFTAARIGVSASQLQAFEGAARLAGGAAGSMTTGMENLAGAMYEAISGRAPQTVALFNQLGVAFQDAGRHALNTGDVMKNVANSIQKMNGNVQAQLYVLRSLGFSADLLPLFQRGSKGIDELNAKMAFFGVTTQAGVDAANRMRIAQTDLDLAVQGLGNSLSEKLAPIIGPLLEQMANWIALNRGWLSTQIADKVKELGDYLKAINWRAIGDDLKWFVDHARLLVEIGLGAWAFQTAAAMAPLALAMTAISAPVWAAAAALTGLAAAYVALRNASAPYDAALAEKNALQATVNALPPGKRAQFDALQEKHHGALMAPHDTGYPGATTAHLMRPHTSANTSLSATRRAFLDTLAGPESGGRYNVKNGGSLFSGFGRFPEGVASGGTSTAAGRYQFTSGTWKEEAKKLGLKDFSPANQDTAAWDLASSVFRTRTGRDLEGALKPGADNSVVASALNKIWPSLPGGSQSHETEGAFDSSLAQHYGQLADGQPGQAGAAGKVHVVIEAAPGTSVNSARATGNVSMPKVVGPAVGVAGAAG
jgi:muramidase (phage lysozyme)